MARTMSRLKEMDADLNPRRILEMTQIPHDKARASVTLQKTTVSTFPEFEDTMIAYVSHHTRIILGTSLPPELCLDKARRFLDQSIGWENSVYISMSGDEGGIPFVLNQINDAFKSESKSAYISYFVDRHIDAFNFPQVIEVMKSIKERIGAYSPESFSYISTEQMAANYKDIIWRYIDSVSRHRNLWDYYS
jgi:hypothetical protein